MQASGARLRSLYAALEEQNEGAGDIEMQWTRGNVPEFTVRIASVSGPIALMRVAHDGVTVTTRSGGLHADAGETEIVDTLGIDLRVDFSWDDVRSETADELARLLVNHMRRRMRESDPEPRGPALVA